MQYEFWDLEVEDDRFYITLCFNDVHERLTVPFTSIISFVDPSVKFGLQFSPSIHDAAEEDMPVEKPEPKKAAPKKKSTTKTKGKKGKAAKEEDGTPDDDPHSNVVTLDSFRKNNS